MRGGADRSRTCDPLNANQVLYQLSYSPSYTSLIRVDVLMVGLTRFELVTPRLSSVCSNQLSYRPQRILISKSEAAIKPPGEVRVYPTNPSVVNKNFALSSTFEPILITVRYKTTQAHWMSHPESLRAHQRQAPRLENNQRFCGLPAADNR